jgi:prepilin-type processing-associated H-X9-DG protein
MYMNENKGNYPRVRYDIRTLDKVAAFTNWQAKDPFGKDGPGPNDVTAALFLLLRTQELPIEATICPGDPAARPIHFGRQKGGPADGAADPVAALDPEAAEKAEEAEEAGPSRRGPDATPARAGEVRLPGWPPEPAGPAVAESAQEISNFPSPANLSYSYINPYPSQAAMDAGFKLNYTLAPDFAVAADINPGGDGPVRARPGQMPSATVGRRQPATKPATNWKFDAAMLSANSPNHGGFGQNVLYGDGHVEWQPTPFCGMARDAQQAPNRQPARDNIYVRERIRPGQEGDPIVGPVSDHMDSILLPTAAPRQAAPAPADK